VYISAIGSLLSSGYRRKYRQDFPRPGRQSRGEGASARATRVNAFDAGSSFTVAGVPLAKNAAVVELGVEAQLRPTMTLVASYGSQFGSGQKASRRIPPA
jgi:hypothetical protein